MKKKVLLLSVVLVAVSCSSMQKIKVITVPPGADITLSKYGVKTISAHSPGTVYGSGNVQNFQDPPISLGTAPLEYEFPLSETGTSAHIPATIYLSIEKNIIEGSSGLNFKVQWQKSELDFQEIL
jgi:hypothetical protein